MAQRLRFYDLRLSRLPSVVGKCQNDLADLARYINDAQERLIMCKEAGDEGWYGTFAEIAFNLSRTQPYITFPREIARLEAVAVCDNPVAVQNQFYEYLQFGNGRLPKQFIQGHRSFLQGYSRNNAVTFTDLTNGPQFLQAYCSDPSDADGTKRILFQGNDQNGKPIYTQDSTRMVTGEFVNFASPFSTSTYQYTQISGIQKDITNGSVQIFQLDPTTGAQVLILTMEPGEQTAWYRRYYFHDLPCNCCPPPGLPQTNCSTIQVTAIAKLDLIPVAVDTDYTLIQSKQAIIEECQAIRYSEVDTIQAKQMAREKHAQAIGFLNGELDHFLGKDTPAVNFAPFGTARLERRKIGGLI